MSLPRVIIQSIESRDTWRPIISAIIYKTEIQETVQNKPVFDPDFHTELIIKDEFEDLDSGNLDLGK